MLLIKQEIYFDRFDYLSMRRKIAKIYIYGGDGVRLSHLAHRTKVMTGIMLMETHCHTLTFLLFAKYIAYILSVLNIWILI